MDLNEHQSKRILREIGVRVPSGRECSSAHLVDIESSKVGPPPWVVKAQISAGGRAKGHFRGDPQARGGVRFVDTIEQLRTNTQQMLGSTLITEQTGNDGGLVRSVYIETKCSVQDEFYLALTVDAESGQLVFVVSKQGGTAIESVAAANPEAIYQHPVMIDSAFEDAPVIADKLDLEGAPREELLAYLPAIVSEFVDKDMRLLEINPLALTTDGHLVALDALVTFDDNAMFRQGHTEQMDAYLALSSEEFAAANQKLNYHRLDGNVGLLSAGAGLAMATMDAIVECGGQPANFLDVPPSTSVATLKNAIEIVTSNPEVRCLLINVFGGGIMRCDAVADAILLAHQHEPFKVPVVVRFAGTNAKLAKQRISASLPQIELADDLGDAAEKCSRHAQSPQQPADAESTPNWLQSLKQLLPQTSK
ncbi:MAG: ADP-forming succinate--CoA ligase subunit beta [Granulosicoccus sp.]|nr:ADP-forming succinate--CoA ligase subunit beta [Granulosicoccus sp.]